ncbi:MAG: cache domain-containing protein, partial [Limnochordia bacterium]
MIGRLSIGAKIALFTGALVLFVAAGLSIFGYLYTSNRVLDQVEATLITHATQAAKRIESELRTETEVLRVFALQPGLDSMGSYVQRLTLSEYLDRMASFLALAVVSPSGTAYYQDGTTAELGDRDYVQKAFAGETAISDILLSRVTNEQVIMIAVPIMRGETVVGAVIGRKDSTFLSDVIMRL